VVIESGNPILMPWKDKVAAIIEAWYPGEAGGKAHVIAQKTSRYW
jgi:beta-glucosidase